MRQITTLRQITARSAALTLLVSMLLLLTPASGMAETGSVRIAVRQSAVAPADHPLAVVIEAPSVDPGAAVTVTGSGYVKPAGQDGSVVTIRVIGSDGVALRPGAGRVPLRNPETGALLDGGLGDWAVVKADPSGTFRTTFRLPNGRDSAPRFDAQQTYSLQVITGTAGANDLVSSIGSASGTGDTRLIAGRSDSLVAPVPPPRAEATAPPQPAWRTALLPAAALLAAAVIALVLARRRDPRVQPGSSGAQL